MLYVSSPASSFFLPSTPPTTWYNLYSLCPARNENKYIRVWGVQWGGGTSELTAERELVCILQQRAQIIKAQ